MFACTTIAHRTLVNSCGFSPGCSLWGRSQNLTLTYRRGLIEGDVVLSRSTYSFNFVNTSINRNKGIHLHNILFSPDSITLISQIIVPFPFPMSNVSHFSSKLLIISPPPIIIFSIIFLNLISPGPVLVYVLTHIINIDPP